MGAWGTGIFDDDTACDVRDYYLQLLIDGIPDEEATQQLLEGFEDDANDPDYALIFWAALAATQWELGRLEESVKQKALSLIEQGDSPLWQEQEEFRGERKAVLTELKNRLNSPQPPRMDRNALVAYNGEIHGSDTAEPEPNIAPEQPELPRRPEQPDEGKKWWQFWK